MKTLNLIDTPYGTGSISLNADGDHFIFKDVMFSNANYDTNFAALAFSMSLTNPQKTNYILRNMHIIGNKNLLLFGNKLLTS